ncbi:HxlR family transcriptional regulator [Paraburkholderia rhizosphaerae]|uniref:HxlR family transcriptional regulator n=1 Tax=Paraburkholderia rhizosphaerae TaxID=480658 RepID=A0A4R8LZC1_9BURK|nr:HxlR family transcriptional regulator [Paraburkholderia rhizosphaerae]
MLIHVPEISQRMLTLDLRALEQASLVRRTVFAEVPVKVEYQLTQDGERLRPVVEVMREFGLWLKSRPQCEPDAPQPATVKAMHAVPSSLDD